MYHCSLQIAERALRENLLPNATTYTILMRNYCLYKRPELAVMTMHHMIATRVYMIATWVYSWSTLVYMIATRVYTWSTRVYTWRQGFECTIQPRNCFLQL